MKRKKRENSNDSAEGPLVLVPVAFAKKLGTINRELDALIAGSGGSRSQIQEQLRQCPEAFKAGEVIEKLFNTSQLGEERPDCQRLLPPPGTAIPPFA